MKVSWILSIPWDSVRSHLSNENEMKTANKIWMWFVNDSWAWSRVMACWDVACISVVAWPRDIGMVGRCLYINGWSRAGGMVGDGWSRAGGMVEQCLYISGWSRAGGILGDAYTSVTDAGMVVWWVVVDAGVVTWWVDGCTSVADPGLVACWVMVDPGVVA